MITSFSPLSQEISTASFKVLGRGLPPVSGRKSIVSTALTIPATAKIDIGSRSIPVKTSSRITYGEAIAPSLPIMEQRPSTTFLFVVGNSSVVYR